MYSLKQQRCEVSGPGKVDARSVQLRASSAVKSACGDSTCMSIVRQKSAQEQFRCRLSAGVLVYEQIIPAAGGPNNYQKADRKVVEKAWADFYTRPEGKAVS